MCHSQRWSGQTKKKKGREREREGDGDRMKQKIKRELFFFFPLLLFMPPNLKGGGGTIRLEVSCAFWQLDSAEGLKGTEWQSSRPFSRTADNRLFPVELSSAHHRNHFKWRLREQIH